MNKLKITGAEDGATFAVRVVPRASKNEIAGIHGDALKIRVTAPPVEGRANEALIAFLAKRLGVRKSEVEIVAGATSRRKMIHVSGVLTQEVEERLWG